MQRINFWKIGSNCFDRIVLIEVRVYALRLWHAIEVGTCSWRMDVKVFCCWNLLSDCLVFLESRGVHFGAHFANDTASRKLNQGVKDNLTQTKTPFEHSRKSETMEGSGKTPYESPITKRIMEKSSWLFSVFRKSLKLDSHWSAELSIFEIFCRSA